MKTDSPDTLYEPAWAYQPDLCPADQHFIEYMQAQKERGLTILHVGTGGHHMVGKYLTPAHYVLGITLSPEEHTAYLPLESMLTRYRVLFGDIYTLPSPLLGKFDVITLFHLGEIYRGKPELREIETRHLLERLSERHLQHDGRILTYRNSVVADWILPLTEETLCKGRFVNFGMEQFKSLDIYRI